MPSESIRTILALVLLMVVCLAMPHFLADDPLAIQIQNRLLPPGAQHVLGTDELGRDLLSRILHGTALTVTVSTLALLTSLAIGIALGTWAGYSNGGWPDRLISWVADLLVSVPFIVVLAGIASLTGPGVWKAYGLLSMMIWVGPARIVRAEVRQTLALEYVLAERAVGASEWRILWRTVMPVCVRSATLFSVGYLPEVIAIEAGLSFMGLGVQPPQPALGKMIFEGMAYITSAWWIAIFPAAMLFVLVATIQAAAGSARTSRR